MVPWDILGILSDRGACNSLTLREIGSPASFNHVHRWNLVIQEDSVRFIDSAFVNTIDKFKFSPNPN
jgi:hypothetical protein